jgi:hypothetical protein
VDDRAIVKFKVIERCSLIIQNMSYDLGPVTLTQGNNILAEGTITTVVRAKVQLMKPSPNLPRISMFSDVCIFAV